MTSSRWWTESPAAADILDTGITVEINRLAGECREAAEEAEEPWPDNAVEGVAAMIVEVAKHFPPSPSEEKAVDG